MRSIDGIHVWRIDQDAGAPNAEELEKLLSGRERERASRFHQPIHRNRYVVSHAATREILAGYLDTSPASLEFRFSKEGKPSIEPPGDPRFYFNLSHAESLCVLAVTTECEVGIDIEPLREVPDLGDIAERFFSAAERSQLEAMPASGRSAAFLRGWAAKEAFAKAIGTGLDYPFREIEVELRPDLPLRINAIGGLAEPAYRWNLSRLDLAPGFVCATAVEAPRISHSILDWSPLAT